MKNNRRAIHQRAQARHALNRKEFGHVEFAGAEAKKPALRVPPEPIEHPALEKLEHPTWFRVMRPVDVYSDEFTHRIHHECIGECRSLVESTELMTREKWRAFITDCHSRRRGDNWRPLLERRP